MTRNINRALGSVAFAVQDDRYYRGTDAKGNRARKRVVTKAERRLNKAVTAAETDSY